MEKLLKNKRYAVEQAVSIPLESGHIVICLLYAIQQYRPQVSIPLESGHIVI